MEPIELVSLHIAVPVLGVILCAVLVFVFGFRSPAQPPKFEEDKRNRKRSKKVKSVVVGNTASAESTGELVSKSTPKPAKEVKSNSSPRAVQNESKSVSRKVAKQDVKVEKKDKVKKETAYVEVKTENRKKRETNMVKKENEEDGQWTTIQVSKKGKKQKPVNKKDNGRAESAIESENEPEFTSLPEAAAAAASQVTHVDKVENTSSDQASTASKREKEKVEAKDKIAGKREPSFVPPVEKPSSSGSFMPHNEVEGKKKKGKKETKSSGEAAASASENLPQDAASAAGKAVRTDPNMALAPASAPALSITEQAKSDTKKKKDTGKESVQGIISEKSQDTEFLHKPAVAGNNSVESKTVSTHSEVPTVKPEYSSTSQAQLQKSDSVAAEQPAASVLFDEMGVSWQEAAPKIKKKKSRREN